MEFIIILGIFGAFCLTAGYLLGAARAEIAHMKTAKLIRKMDRTQCEMEALRAELTHMIEDAMAEESAKNQDG